MGHETSKKGHKNGEVGHTHTFLRNVCPASTMSRFVPDWSELGEKDFSAALARISSVAELEGVANRRKYLRAPDLPKWNDWQRNLILQRKWELEQNEQNDARLQKRKRTRASNAKV